VNPLVSVIIPVYNRLEFLKEAVGSVNNQTFTDFELIAADDGSTDGCGAWLEAAGIRTVTLKHSGLPGLVRNAGTAAARGALVAFLDSDDVWLPAKLERQTGFFKSHPDIAICHTREIWNRNGKIISQAGQRQRRSGMIFEDALKKCIIGPSTVMMRRSLLEAAGGFAPDLEIAEDYELWIRVTAVYDVGYIDEPLVEKRGGHADQLSEKYGQIEAFRIQALLKALERGAFLPEQRLLIVKELRRKCEIHAQGALKRGKTDESERYLALAESVF
jgi:glycosyltransferase involved in cell wall biosynthesis